MKKQILCLFLCLLTLCGCAAAPAESQATTIPSPETTAPADIPAPANTAVPEALSDPAAYALPEESSLPDWVPAAHKCTNYPSYLARVRTPVYSWNSWQGAKDGNTYHLDYTVDGYCVCSFNASVGLTTHWVVPGSNDLTGISFLLCDGVWAYGVRGGTELLRMELLSGETETLFTADQFLCGSTSASGAVGNGTNMLLMDHDWLYFLARVDNSIRLYRMYLPTKTLDLLCRQIPGDTLLHALYLIPPEHTGEIQIVYMDPQMQELILETLRDHKSLYKASIYVSIYSADSQKPRMEKVDFTPLWELKSPETTMQWNPAFDFLSVLLQADQDIPAKRILTYNTRTGEVTDVPAWAKPCDTIQTAAEHLMTDET